MKEKNNTTICFVLPMDLKKKVKEYSQNNLIPINAIVRQALVNFFNSKEKENK